MRIILLLIAMTSIFANAQDSTLSKSKYEKFTSRTGVMLKMETIPAGEAKDYRIDIFKSTDIQTGETLKAIFMKQEKNMFLVGKYTTHLLIIDWEEAGDFLKALKFQKELLETKPQNDVTYSYSTKNGVVAVASFNKSGMFEGWNIAFSRVYEYSRLTIDGSTVTLKNKDLAVIIRLFEEALKKEG